MTPLISARRAAEDFARLVDGSQADVADRYTDLTDCVDYLRAQAEPVSRPEFVADLRSRLMAAADTLLVPAEPTLAPVVPLTQPTRRRERRIAAMAAAAVIVGGSAGVAAAAEGSLPGDTLYPVKRAIESAQISLNSSDAAKGQDLVAQAGTRLDEIDDLINDGGSTAQITHTLASFERSASNGADLLFVAYQRDGDTEGLSKLRGRLSEQATRLAELRRQAPPTTQPDFASASALVADLDQQARVLCGNCGPDNRVGNVSSAQAFQSLLTRPARTAADQELADRAKALADKANQVAQNTPQVPATTTGTGTTSGSGSPLPGAPVPNLPGQTSPVTSTVTTVTGGVQGLLGTVSTSTGGILDPVTDPVTDTLDSVTGLLTGQ
jgi:hypothetical protein